ncbi:hypothetical protein D3C72_2301590 [compost metagenome]
MGNRVVDDEAHDLVLVGAGRAQRAAEEQDGEQRALHGVALAGVSSMKDFSATKCQSA